MVNSKKGLSTNTDKRWILSLIIISGWILAHLSGFITPSTAQAQPPPISKLTVGCLSLPPVTTLYLPLITGSTLVQAGLKLQAPDQGAYHAAFPGFVTEDEEPAPATVEKIEQFESLAGKEIVWAYFNNEWTDGIHFPKEDICTIHR